MSKESAELNAIGQPRRTVIECRNPEMVRTLKSKKARDNTINALSLVLFGWFLCGCAWGLANFIERTQLAYMDVYGQAITRPTTIRTEFGHRPDAWKWYEHEFIGFDPSFEDNDDYMDGK